MEQRIDSGDVKSISTQVTAGEGCHLVSVFIHHELSAEKVEALMSFLEPLVIRAVAGWVKL